MKRCLIPIFIVLVLVLGLCTGCAPDLPKEEEKNFFTLAYDAGYSWGYLLTAENQKRTDVRLIPPDRVDAVQKLNPNLNVHDFYIPKGYWTLEDVANAHFPDGTPFNKKQKTQVMEAHNWGFYSGFMQGSKDYIEGKPYRSFP